MTQSLMSQSQQSAIPSESALWALGAGEALRLDIGPGARELQVTQGRLWLTREGTLDQPSEDLWLQAGDTVALASGSEWVLEGWGHDGGGACFQLLVPPRACATMARRQSAAARSPRRGLLSSLWPAHA